MVFIGIFVYFIGVILFIWYGVGCMVLLVSVMGFVGLMMMLVIKCD